MINQTFDEFMKDIYGLKNLERYQTAVRLKSESVAEHSFFVSALVLKLHDLYEFDLLKALKMAITHDYTELYLSDVPSPVKNRFPKIREAMEEAEQIVALEKLGTEYAELMEEFNSNSSPEGVVCAYADICSCIQYATLEVELGNKDYMSYVLANSKVRVEKMRTALNAFSRNQLNKG